MISAWTAERLLAFSDRVAQAFKDKLIKAPVHLCGGNEAELIEIFKCIEPDDWVFSTWRSSYHALLKGWDEEEVYNEILCGRSMYLTSKSHNFMAGSIVSGMLPIACGIALGIRLKSLDQRVYVFVGDMAARSGLFWETIQYAMCNRLRMTFIIEDNGLSTDTPTDSAWGQSETYFGRLNNFVLGPTEVKYYRYKRTRPHVGIGQHVQF